LFSWCGATLAILFLVGCERADETHRVTALPSPAGPGSGESSLTVGEDGKLYLSWIESQSEDHVFEFASWQGNAWSAPREIARGRDWVVNGADVPALTVLGDGRTMMAHWLVQIGTEGEAYGIRVTRSQDGGETWSPSIIPHRDSTATEHGFVSWNPISRDRAALVWLDGRETTHGGATTLRFATLDANGAMDGETLVDTRVCDCCSTDLAGEDSSLVVVYRDRSEEDIRDIRIARYDGTSWTEGPLVHSDGWKIAGCPVNGPAVAMHESLLAVTWFTVDAADHAHVRLSFSRDAGRTFQDPLEIGGPDPLGRVGIALTPDGAAWILWLETVRNGQAEIRLRKADVAGHLGEPIVVATTSASHASGIPRLACLGNELFMAWTGVAGDVEDGTRVLTARIR